MQLSLDSASFSNGLLGKIRTVLPKLQRGIQASCVSALLLLHPALGASLPAQIAAQFAKTSLPTSFIQQTYFNESMSSTVGPSGLARFQASYRSYVTRNSGYTAASSKTTYSLCSWYGCSTPNFFVWPRAYARQQAAHLLSRKPVLRQY